MKRSGWWLAVLLMCTGAWAQDEPSIVVIEDDVQGFEELEALDEIHIEIDGLEFERIGDQIREALRSAREGIEVSREVIRDSLRHSLDQMHAQAEFAPLMYLPNATYGVTRDVNLVKRAPDVRMLSVENIAGSVTVIGCDEDTITVEGKLGEDVEELVFDVSGSSATIEVKVPNRRARQIKSDLTIHLPRRSGVDIETVSASIGVEGLDGDEIQCQTVSGAIRIEQCRGEIDAETTSGSITIDDATREVEAETVSGAIKVQGSPTHVTADAVSGSITATGVREEFDAESISGAVVVYAAGIEEVDVETVSGSITFDGTAAHNADLRFNTLSGAVRILLAEPLYGEYNLKSFSGSIDVDFGRNVEGAPRSVRSKQIEFELGDGDANVEVECFSGSIRVQVN